jgi:hypothetical protein
MAEEQEIVPVPARYSRVDPWMISHDTAAEIVFLETVDTAELARRLTDQAAKEAMAHVQQSLSSELSGTS